VSSALARATLSLAVSALFAVHAAAKEESKIQVPLENLGVEAGAHGDLRSKLDVRDARLQLRARGLAGSGEYRVLTDGIEQARFVTQANGHANVTFELAVPDEASPGIPFDPRGHYVAVNDGVQDVLGAFYSMAGEPARTKVKEWTDLAPESAAGEGHADARYDRRPNGKAMFRVQLRHAPPGAYDVLVAGNPVGSLQTNSSGGGRLDFRTKPGKGNGRGHGLALDFDPRGEWLELKQGDAVFFSGTMLAQIEGLNVCVPSESSVPFTAAAGEGGSGTATLAVEEDCDLDLRVELAGLVPGAHELRVDGVLLAALTADGIGAAMAELSSDPDEMGEAPLAVDPSGGLLEVVRGSDDAVVMSATLP
jgi:hypothetical protein